MRVPHVSERVKEAPAQALRGVFAGIGQLLLITDRLRNKPPEAPSADTAETTETQTVQETGAASAEAAPKPGQAPEPTQSPEPAERDFDKTGNVRLLTPEDTESDRTAAVIEPETEVTAEAETITGTAGPKAEATTEAEGVNETKVSAAPVETASAEAALPLASYDELSVNSLRARLRNLTAAQVAQLAEYEKAHAARPEVVTMFERRIAKLEADG
jgi:cytoskeletal protein RodZ